MFDNGDNEALQIARPPSTAIDPFGEPPPPLARPRRPPRGSDSSKAGAAPNLQPKMECTYPRLELPKEPKQAIRVDRATNIAAWGKLKLANGLDQPKHRSLKTSTERGMHIDRRMQGLKQDF